MSRAKILIAGAGLGGLVAGLALLDRGFHVDIHEQASALGEVGAGLTLSRGAQHVFRALGLMDSITPLACPSTNFPFLHYRTGRVLTGALDHGDGSPDDGTADVGRQMHRADLHAVLSAAFAVRAPATCISATAWLTSRRPPPTCAPASLMAPPPKPTAWSARTASAPPPAPCSGARRRRATPASSPTVSWWIATARAPSWASAAAPSSSAPAAPSNRYTLRAGAVVNCVGIVAHDAWTDDGWSTPATIDELAADFAGWHKDVTGLMTQAGALIKWGLFDRAPLPAWRRGRATLLGDAAHAMLPFLGMGAAMAIEDGMILARAMDSEPSIQAGFDRYEATRRPRTALVHAKSVEQGRQVQARDPDHYDAAAAPASDPAIFAFDPVTALLAKPAPCPPERGLDPRHPP